MGYPILDTFGHHICETFFIDTIIEALELLGEFERKKLRKTAFGQHSGKGIRECWAGCLNFLTLPCAEAFNSFPAARK